MDSDRGLSDGYYIAGSVDPKAEEGTSIDGTLVILLPLIIDANNFKVLGRLPVVSSISTSSPAAFQLCASDCYPLLLQSILPSLSRPTNPGPSILPQSSSTMPCTSKSKSTGRHSWVNREPDTKTLAQQRMWPKLWTCISSSCMHPMCIVIGNR